MIAAFVPSLVAFCSMGAGIPLPSGIACFKNEDLLNTFAPQDPRAAKTPHGYSSDPERAVGSNRLSAGDGRREGANGVGGR